MLILYLKILLAKFSNIKLVYDRATCNALIKVKSIKEIGVTINDVRVRVIHK